MYLHLYLIKTKKSHFLIFFILNTFFWYFKITPQSSKILQLYPNQTAQ
jgi:hypothetical protein